MKHESYFSVGPLFPGALTMAERDRHLAAFVGMILGKRVEGVTPFNSLHESYRVINKHGDREAIGPKIFGELLLSFDKNNIDRANAGELVQVHLRESVVTSTTWGALASAALERALIEYFSESPYLSDVDRLVSTFTGVSDFRFKERYLLNAASDLPDVAEEGTYPDIYEPAGDQKQQYKPTKKGGVVYYTLEAAQADDLGAFQQLPRIVSFAAARSLYTKVLATFVGNPVTTYDGLALVHANHNNILIPGIPADFWSFAETMQSQIDTTGRALNISPKYIVLLNTGNTATAWTALLKSAFTGAGPQMVLDDFWKRFGFFPIFVPAGIFTLTTLPANFVWAIADSDTWQTIEVGFLNGRREPQFLVANAPKEGARFYADKIALKAMYVFGTVFLNHRMIVGALS
jgi:hypothetical protein